MPIDPQWLEQNREETLEPEMAICDPHHHLWDYRGSRYLLDELLEDTGSGHNVVSTVFVECMSMYRAVAPEAMAPVGETEFVQGVAAQSASGQYGDTRACAGIVSYADLRLGSAVDAVLEAHQLASPNRFRGVRHACSWDASPEIRNSHTRPPPQLYLDETFREGLACVAARGLVFDSWLYHTQHRELLELAKLYPNLTIVVDHVGGPLGSGPYAGRRAEIFETWSEGIADLAACDNVVVKLGGLGMPINGFNWQLRASPPGSEELAEAYEPYILFCVEQFGAQRCMFESNFPVDKVSSSYNVLWNAFKRITAGMAEAERAALFHDTAARVYTL